MNQAASNRQARVLVVAGSTRQRSRTRVLCRIAEETLRQAGAEVRWLDLRVLQLPVLENDNPEQSALPSVKEAREAAEWADGFVLGTPEYHGGVSGALKNWLDFQSKAWLAGKLVGVVSVSGGDHGGDLSAVATKRCANWCHAFTLPYSATARRGDWDDLTLVNPDVEQRVRRLAVDVVRYATVLRAAFEAAKKLGDGVEAGFAGWHA